MPDESDKETTFPPSRFILSVAYCATFPDPETVTILSNTMNEITWFLLLLLDHIGVRNFQEKILKYLKNANFLRKSTKNHKKTAIFH